MAPSINTAFVGLLAALALVCKTASADDRHIQNEIQKRIFCNFYGCGSKRSQPDNVKPKFMDSSLQGELTNGDSSADFPELFSEQGSSVPAGFRSGFLGDYSQNGGEPLAAMLDRDRVAKTVAMWEALQGRARARQQRLHRRHAQANKPLA